jgi:hypothetical protein
MDNTIEQIENIKNRRQINIWLDSYDDIFSGSDQRPYSERILSDNFITELKKVSGEDVFDIGELHLLLHEKNRKQESEPTITKRVHTYFKKGSSYLSRRIIMARFQAIVITLSGVLLIVLASYLFGTHSNKFYIKLLFVLFEPSGWFFVWTGMEDLLFGSPKQREELDFFSKLAKAKVVFVSF